MTIEAFTKGDTKRWLLTLTDPESGDPLDLAGATVIVTFKTAPADADNAPGAVNLFITDHTAPGVPGQTICELSAAASAALLPGRRYHYWVKVVLSDNTVATADSGRVMVDYPGTDQTTAPAP